MIRLPPRSTRTTLCPYTTLSRSEQCGHEHAGQQQAAGIGKARAQRDGAGRRVDRRFGKLDRAGRRIGAAVFEPECRSEEHTSELQSLMRISYAVFCLKKKKKNNLTIQTNDL